MNIFVGILCLIGCCFLALWGVFVILLLIYLLLNFSQKFIYTSRKPIKPPTNQGYKTSPECNTTYKSEKVKNFIRSFLLFWCPFKTLESRINTTHIVNDRNEPCEHRSEKYTLNNTPQISSDEFHHVKSIIRRLATKCKQYHIYGSLTKVIKLLTLCEYLLFNKLV